MIVSRAFEEAYQERDTAASILAGLGASSDLAPGETEVAGRYVRVRLGQSDRVAAPGHRLTLTLDVTPGDKIHVYAPGQQGYIPVALKLDPSPDVRTAPTRFPPSSMYFFAPLEETVKVYEAAFRLSADVTLLLTPSMRQRATARESLTLKGTLEYQACDDKVCYRPDSVPVSWTIALTPIER